MQRKKLPVGLVVAFVVLVVAGILINGAETMKFVGLNMGKPPEPNAKMEGKELTDAEVQEQKDSMIKARASRAQEGGDGHEHPGNPAKPALLIEPDQGNFKQTFNASTTAGQWYTKESLIEKKKRENEALRNGAKK